MNNRIGIVGWWFAQNYGSVATYYALYKSVESLGYSPIFIDCGKERKGSDTNIFSRIFMEKHACISESYPRNELYKLNDAADAFLLGSDQVWTPGSIKNMDGYFFFLDFVDSDKKKIAYAISFGQSSFSADEETIKRASYQASLFDCVSTRETIGVSICKETLGIDAERVLDPCFLLPISEYNSIADESNKSLDTDYILTYTLDPTDDKRKLYLDASDKLGIPLINILDGRKNTIKPNNEKLNLPNTDISVEEADWINYIRNAKYVITDSHHGLAMALIYNKPVICYANKSRGLSRFESLLSLLKISDRLVFSSEEVKERNLLNKAIDYDSVNNILETEKKRGLEWLQKALSSPKRKALNKCAITKALEEYLCTGCGACVSECPTDALSLTQDKLGYYRSNLNDNKCINCGKCTDVCPALKLPVCENRKKPKCMAFVAKDEETLITSSSGGAFSCLAEVVLESGGIVSGAAWKEDFSVEHIIINNLEDLEKLKKSKYLQSYTGNVFRQLKNELDEGKQVLFSGCPCQVAGIKAYLKKDYSNLILVDLLCGNAPSFLFFKKYIEEEFPKGIKAYEFRYKGRNWVPGWGAREVLISHVDGKKEHRHGSEEDIYQQAYHEKTMCSIHCEKCRYQNFPRFGDITIGDFWGIHKHLDDLQTKQGVSVILANNDKAETFLSRIHENSISVLREVPIDWLGGNGYAFEGMHNHASEKRDDFYDKFLDSSFSKAVNGIYDIDKTGAIRKVCSNSPTYIQIDSKQLSFQFDKSLATQEFSNGHIIIKGKLDKVLPGNYVTLPLASPLTIGKEFWLCVGFKIKTDNKWFNFHLIENGTNVHESITAINVENRNNGKDQIEITKVFSASRPGYDALMFGISQLSGKDNFIDFDYIYICESDLIG